MSPVCTCQQRLIVKEVNSSIACLGRIIYENQGVFVLPGQSCVKKKGGNQNGKD